MPNANQQLVFQWTAMRVRLIAAFLMGLAVFVLSDRLFPDLRFLLAYDLAVATYLALLVVRFIHADETATRDLAERKEKSYSALLALAAIISGCSLAGVGFMIHRSKHWTPLMANVHVGLSLLAVFFSWILLHAVFAIHYARLYYDPTPPANESVGRPPLRFPDDQQPDYWDFIYFALTLAVCYQVSDVTIRSRHLRRVALAHMFLSFLNVTMILGLVVEIVSTLPGRRRDSRKRIDLDGGLSSGISPRPGAEKPATASAYSREPPVSASRLVDPATTLPSARGTILQ